MKSDGIDPNHRITVGDLCGLTGLSRTHLMRLRADGVITQVGALAGHGESQYLLGDVARVVKHYQKGGGASEKKMKAQARQATAAARKAELQNAVMAGELVNRDEMKRVLSERLVEFREVLLGLSGQVRRVSGDRKVEAEVEAVVQRSMDSLVKVLEGVGATNS